MDRPEQAVHPDQGLSNLHRFTHDLRFSAVRAGVFAGVALAADVVAPGAGVAVKAAHLIIQLASGLSSLERGEGFTYEVPIAAASDISLNIEFRLCENDPPPMLQGTLGLDYVDEMAPGFFPTVDGAGSGPDESGAAAAHGFQPQPPTQRINVVTEYLLVSRPSRPGAPNDPGPDNDPTITTHLQPQNGFGWIVVDPGDGSPYTPATIEIRGTCLRCGLVARRGPLGQLRCEHCSQRS